MNCRLAVAVGRGRPSRFVVSLTVAGSEYGTALLFAGHAKYVSGPAIERLTLVTSNNLQSLRSRSRLIEDASGRLTVAKQTAARCEQQLARGVQVPREPGANGGYQEYRRRRASLVAAIRRANDASYNCGRALLACQSRCTQLFPGPCIKGCGNSDAQSKAFWKAMDNVSALDRQYRKDANAR